jgi:hypothetical protein
MRGDAGAMVTSDGAGPRDAAAVPDANLADAPQSEGEAGSDGNAAADAAATKPSEKELPYARHVLEFKPGSNAGFGQTKFPKVVLGPPKGGGTSGGSSDVLSLGEGGEIVLDFGDKTIVDGDGPDFIVFENAFWQGGNASQPFAEPGQVSVSADGKTWVEFPCDLSVTDGAHPFPGCAGVAPTLKYDPFTVLPLDVEITGGDAFDLADVSMQEARFVRIQDRSQTPGLGNSAGFDLDAVGIVNLEP